jgi:hypothetical protein
MEIRHLERPSVSARNGGTLEPERIPGPEVKIQHTPGNKRRCGVVNCAWMLVLAGRGGKRGKATRILSFFIDKVVARGGVVTGCCLSPPFR